VLEFIQDTNPGFAVLEWYAA